MKLDAKEFGSGAAFLGFGAFYGYMTLSKLRMGSPVDIGPGFFPIILCCLLITIGAVLITRSFRVTSEDTTVGVIAWRGMTMIMLAGVIFALFLEELGLFAAVAIAVLLTSFSTRDMRILPAVALAIGMGTFCSLVFVVGVGLPAPIFGSWLGGH